MSGAAQGMGLQKANKNGKKSCANIRKENDSVGWLASTPLSHRRLRSATVDSAQPPGEDLQNLGYWNCAEITSSGFCRRLNAKTQGIELAL